MDHHDTMVTERSDVDTATLTRENNNMLKEVLKELRSIKKRIDKLEEKGQMEWKVERAKCKPEYLCFLKSLFTRNHYLYYDNLPTEFMDKIKSLLTAELAEASSSNLQKMISYALKKFSDFRGDVRAKLLRSQTNRGLPINDLNTLLWKAYFPVEDVDLECTLKKTLIMRAYAHSKDLFGRIGTRTIKEANNFWINFDNFYTRCMEDGRERKWELWEERDERRRRAFLGEE
ncbi:uncharacterized protein [Ptychodera flava]|uniref:uncharacterized protein n=1 Tax=Ptychodera flava TaxID=63121 RepID=UPI003969E7A8